MDHYARSSMHDAASRAEDRRAAARHEHFEHVIVQSEWGETTGAILDLSQTGGQIRIANGLLPFENDEVMVRLIDARHLCGRVAWVSDTSIGIVFEQPVADVEDFLWAEQRDSGWYRNATRPNS